MIESILVTQISSDKHIYISVKPESMRIIDIQNYPVPRRPPIYVKHSHHS